LDDDEVVGAERQEEHRSREVKKSSRTLVQRLGWRQLCCGEGVTWRQGRWVVWVRKQGMVAVLIVEEVEMLMCGFSLRSEDAEMLEDVVER
jgi:hypothetical protein